MKDGFVYNKTIILNIQKSQTADFISEMKFGSV